MKRDCAEGLTQRLLQLPIAQACSKDLLGTMKRTLAVAGTATEKDYSSQRAVRQLQVEVSLLGMLGFVVSDAFKL